MTLQNTNTYTKLKGFIKNRIGRECIRVKHLFLSFLDAELDNFIGQEPVNVQSQAPSRTHEDSPTNVSSQPKENKDTANQSAKPGYFTSILSSLPNLSLSSAKTDFPQSGSQISQTPENISRAAHESNPYTSPQGRHASQPEAPGFLAINPQDPRNTDLSGFAAFGSPSTAPNPPQSAVPPSLPQSGYGEHL